jgi:hypothetical protein
VPISGHLRPRRVFWFAAAILWVVLLGASPNARAQEEFGASVSDSTVASGDTVEVTVGGCTPGATESVFLDGEEVGSQVIDADGSASGPIDITGAPGVHTITNSCNDATIAVTIIGATTTSAGGDVTTGTGASGQGGDSATTSDELLLGGALALAVVGGGVVLLRRSSRRKTEPSPPEGAPTTFAPSEGPSRNPPIAVDHDTTGPVTGAPLTPPTVSHQTVLGDVPGLVLGAEVGRGGFGSVFRAEQPLLSRTVAVKVLHDALDERATARFERESRAMGMLSHHPNIATVYGTGVTDHGKPYIVMEYFAQGSLEARIDQVGPVPWPDALKIVARLTGALETAHRQGVLHRDIKPGNVMMSDYGEPQLSDFGLARIHGGVNTQTGSLTASLAHVAPELLENLNPTVSSDLYSLGSTLFTLIAGRDAFGISDGDALMSGLLRITRDPVPDLRASGVPSPVCDLIETVMAKDPADRPTSAAALGTQVTNVERVLGLPVTPVSIGAPDSSPAATGTADPTFGPDAAETIRLSGRRPPTPPDS